MKVARPELRWRTRRVGYATYPLPSAATSRLRLIRKAKQVLPNTLHVTEALQLRCNTFQESKPTES